MATSALDQLRSIDNLKDIWKIYWRDHKRSAPGVDGMTPRNFHDNLDRQLRLLRAEIGDSYGYSPLRAIPIEKKNSDKKRLICIPTVSDRLVQRAVLKKIEDRAAQLGIVNDVSFGFVKGTIGGTKGVHAARNAAVSHRQLRPWAFKADISAFFDSIQRKDLVDRFDASFKLRSLRPLVRAAIECEVDDTNPTIRRILLENKISKGKGLRQGMPLSPILSNFVLRDFDQAFGQHGYQLVRYADDLVVFSETEEECRRVQELTIVELEKLGLSVSKDKTMICAPPKAVEFLGMELGLKAGSGKYCLTVSVEQIKAIKEAFSRYHDWSVAQKENLTVASLFRRLGQMKEGYGAAYSAAENITDLNKRLEQYVHNCANAIYSSLFGHQAISKLDSLKRTFLMMP